MPQFDPSTFASQLVWLALTFGALLIFLSSVALPRLEKTLMRRRDLLEEDIKTSKTAQLAAEVLASRMRQGQLQARTEARAIVETIRVDVGKVVAAQRVDLQQQLLIQSEAAARHIAAVRSKAIAEIETAALRLLPEALARIAPESRVDKPDVFVRAALADKL